jgi:hypothetical protein
MESSLLTRGKNLTAIHFIQILNPLAIKVGPNLFENMKIIKVE